MKVLCDQTKVPSRLYYYLLDWNESNDWTHIRERFGKTQLSKLNRREFFTLLNTAMSEDLQKEVDQ